MSAKTNFYEQVRLGMFKVGSQFFDLATPSDYATLYEDGGTDEQYAKAAEVLARWNEDQRCL